MLIAVSCKLSSSIIVLPYSNVEMLCVKAVIDNVAIYAVVVYIPPKMGLHVYENFVMNMEYILKLSSTSDRFIVVGDFNLPEIVWSPDIDNNLCYVPALTPSPSSSYLLESVSAIGLFQINGVMNDFGKLLDLVLCDLPEDIVINQCHGLVLEDRYHPCLELTMFLPSPASDSELATLMRQLTLILFQ